MSTESFESAAARFEERLNSSSPSAENSYYRKRFEALMNSPLMNLLQDSSPEAEAEEAEPEEAEEDLREQFLLCREAHLLDPTSMDAEVAYHKAREVIMQGYDHAGYEAGEYEMEQANDDYIYVRDETLTALKKGVGDFDPEEGTEHSAHRVVVALQETDVLDSEVPVSLLRQKVANHLDGFSTVPTENDFEKIFDYLHTRGWVRI